MKATLIETEGYGLKAVIEIDGRRLNVMDDISLPGKSAESGTEFDIELSPMCLGDQTWDEMFKGNPEKKMDIEPLNGWKYMAFGKIAQINPVIVDCGILKLRDVIHTHDERCIGKYVAININRLDAIAR